MKGYRQRQPQILVAARESSFGGLLTRSIQAWGFDVRALGSLTEVLVAVQASMPDLVVFLDEAQGDLCRDACRRTREVSKVPLLVVCAATDSEHAAEALSLGADDHVRKDVSAKELEARTRAVMRRNQTLGYTEDEAIELGPVTVDCNHAVCRASGSQVSLTPNELKLLRALASQPGTILRHDRLIEQIWGSTYHASPENLRKLVQRLRTTMIGLAHSRPAIVSVPGFGYYLDTQGLTDGQEAE
jgi:DNA-binding response OmpR family regulator